MDNLFIAQIEAQVENALSAYEDTMIEDIQHVHTWTSYAPYSEMTFQNECHTFGFNDLCNLHSMIGYNDNALAEQLRQIVEGIVNHRYAVRQQDLQEQYRYEHRRAIEKEVRSA